MNVRRGLRKLVELSIALSAVTVLFIAGCGGGGGSAAPSTGGSVVTGTLALGHPIQYATITLKDSAGHSTAASSVADGTFTLTTTGFTPPYILQATSGTGQTVTLYSVSADSLVATTINITPLTDIITRSWYNVQGVSTDTAFAALTTYPAPAPTAVETIQTSVQNVFGLWLTNASVPSGTNLISTAFTANSSGVDAVLDQIQSYAPPTASSVAVITVIGGATTEIVNLGYSAGTLSFTTATSGVGGNSSNVISSVVPTSTAQQTALAGIVTTLTNFGNTIASKGSNLSVSDLLPYFSQNFVNDGETASQFAAGAVSSLSNATVSFQNLQLKSLTPTTADVLLSVVESSGGNSQTKSDEWFFTLTNGTWLISGNGRIAKISLQAEMRRQQGANTAGWNTDCGNGPQSTLNPAPDINLDVEPISGVVSAATVQDAHIWTSPCTMIKNATLVQNGLDYDHYVMNTGGVAASAIPPAGTPYTFVLTTVSGTPVSYMYTLPLNALTTDAIKFTSPTGDLPGNYALSNITLGSPLSANWTLPTTYQIATVQFNASVATSTNPSQGFQCQVNGPLLATMATSGTISQIPATCSGLAVVMVTLEVSVTGTNGERSYAMYTFQ